MGAMRNAGDAGYEGPANLRDAVRLAAAPEAREQGAWSSWRRRSWPATTSSRPTPVPTTRSEAANVGPLGMCREGRRRPDAPSRTAPLPAGHPGGRGRAGRPRDRLVGHDGRPLRAALAGGARGIVVAATVPATPHPDLLAAAERGDGGGHPGGADDALPRGRAAPRYGFPGGGARWLAAGAILAGPLGGPKARIALALGLGAGLDEAGLRRLFGP